MSKFGITEGVKRSVMSLERVGSVVPLTPEVICDTIDAVAATVAVDAQMALIDEIAAGANLRDVLARLKAELAAIKPAPKLTTTVRGAA